MKRLLTILLLFCLLAALLPVISAGEALPLSDYEWETLLLTNRARLRENHAPFTATGYLQQACDIRAEEISTVCSHTRPNDTTCFTVLEEVSAPAVSYAGENIAAGQNSPQEVVEAWMNSPGHYANIMDDSYVHLGVGYYETDSGYQQHWVQFFCSTWGCRYTALELVSAPSGMVPAGTSIDDLHLTAKVTCACCGTSYLPVMEEFCTGYDPYTSGSQQVTLSCFGLETEFTVRTGDHTHTYTATVTEPTCTQQGYTTYTCECRNSYVADYVAALGHNYVNGTCTRCGEADPGYKPTDPVDPKPSVSFSDVKGDEWFAQAVNYAVSNGLMNGMGNNKFEPNTGMTRAMLVTVLWRYAGEPVEGENTFTDLTQDWYIPAVTWAAHNGIVGGVGNGKFDPDGNVTREQLATILYRYCNSIGIDTSARADLSAFPDAGKVSAYAEDALSWAVAVGLVTGTQEGSKTYLDPLGNATRAQVATILMRYIENFLK